MTTTNLSDYRGSSIESNELIGDMEHWWRVEVDSEDPTCAYLIWTEGAAWHAELNCPEIVDQDGDILPAAVEALEVELRRLTGSTDLSVSVSSQDEPAFEVGVALKVEPATTARLADLAWPFIATLTNVFDPGTFGAEYAVGNAARTIQEQA